MIEKPNTHYAIALDVGYYDETVVLLAELRDDKLYIIKEKRSNGVGDKKITDIQMEQIREFFVHYKNEPHMRKFYKKIIPDIFGWEEYNATVTVD